MRLQRLTTRNQSGFSAVELVIIVLVLAALAATGFVVYQRHRSSIARNSAVTGSTQTTEQKPSTTITKPQPTTYLDIKEWGIRLPLSNAIKDAYYSFKGSNVTDGLPNTAWLGLTSLDNTGCNAVQSNSADFHPIGSILRARPTDHDPVQGKLYTQLYPNGTTVNGWYYAYAPWKDKSCAPPATLQSIDSAFSTAAKSIAAPQYLTIKEWGVRLMLDSTTASMYYYISSQLPNVAYLSLKAISYVVPNCAADKGSLGAIARLTEAQQRAATANPSDLNEPGTVHIGNYWYNAQNSHAACASPTEDAAIETALPDYNVGELDKALNTLAADPSTGS